MSGSICLLFGLEGGGVGSIWFGCVCVCVIGVLDDEGACGRELDQIWL